MKRGISRTIRKKILIKLVSLLVSACGGGSTNSEVVNPITESNTPSNPSSETTINGCEVDVDQQALLAAVNQARSQTRACGSQSFSSTAPLQWNCLLASASARHSLDMATHNFFSHTGSDGSIMATRVQATGYNYRSLGENIAAGMSKVDQVMAAWLSSPGHCANIMDPQFTELGAAVEYNAGTNYGYYWTQNFGQPK